MHSIVCLHRLSICHAESHSDFYIFGTRNVRWETGAPSADAKAARAARFSNSRTQMTSSFPPIKRLTLERKSPVTRLDINAPGFEAYKRTYPGLYKKL